VALVALIVWVAHAAVQTPPPLLTGPVNDFANVISEADEAAIEKDIRDFLNSSGDVVVVATVESIAPYADIREYAGKMFENQGRGIGQKGNDNGVLVVLALKERRVQIEAGYDLEEFITDGFSGSTSRDMVPYFRKGEYGTGLHEIVTRIIQRIADGRGITLKDRPSPVAPAVDQTPPLPPILLFGLFILFIFVIMSLNRASVSRRRHRRWGGGPWSGWDSGVGPFGGWGGSGGTFGGGFGGFGGGRGGGGFGGFGGFGGGRSGGGGGGAGW
jgi:uncharacterized protein